MLMSRTVKSWLQVLLLVAVTSATACAGPPSRVYVRVGPPVPIVEARVASPGAGFVWIEGFHRWSGREYVWVPGRWERPPRPRAAWIAGHWVHQRRGWYFVEGHWR